MITNVEVYSSLSSAPDLPLDLGGVGADDPIHIRDLQGLGPVKATVSTQQYGDMDGEFYTGTSVGKRNIVMIVGFNPDWVTNTVAGLRQKLYGYFMPKQPVRLRLFSDEWPAVEIDGYTESCEPNIFAKDPEMTISIICPSPDFVAAAPTLVEGIASEDAEWFDFSLVGNVPTSVDLLLANAEGDTATYEGDIDFQYKTLLPVTNHFKAPASLDDITAYHFDSQTGAKKVENLYLGGERQNLLNVLSDDSIWPKLMPGVNSVRVILDAGAEEFPWVMTYYERFGGL